MLVCGRPGDRGGGTETPAASVPRHKVQARHARYSEIRNPVWVIFAEGNRIVKNCVVVLNYLFGVSKNSQFRENDSVRKKTWLREKSRVFAVRIISFHKSSERCDLIWSLNGAKAFPFQLNVRLLN